MQEVVDESDRLLRQAYQDWLPSVIESLDKPALTENRRGMATQFKDRVIKIIVSATLTQDPAKMKRLNLYSPKYIAMASSGKRYKVPKQLKEFKIVSAAVDKPIVLVALLRHLSMSKCIIFTSSLVATHRLYSVLAELFGENVREYSSTIAKKGAESQALRAFKDGKANILVASDAVSRGMDVPGMDVVINYDSTSYAKTYVHRAGRTARAGGKGSVVTLLTTEQVHHFKAMLYKIDNTYVRDYKLPPNSVNEARKETQQALEKAAEKLGEEIL